ncbi:MAG: 16S rRNA (cytosine(967)-C(5))-methyltransferase RsmB [Pseudomonadales bacterium]|jgi:16S rRNA (cytosine967-C5)-methyltransferase|nr:16S rRNA (cytosine(967)-C(5))-methyltransferase RsmB [Pseudomonadales bacterium]
MAAELHRHYCRILLSIRQRQGSLSSLLDAALKRQLGADAARLQEWCYGVCRWYHRLDAIAAQLLERPLRGKDQDLHSLILLGLYQLYFMRTPDHAVLNETVAASDALHKPWAKGLINAVLREAQRSRDTLLEHCAKDYSQWYSHPVWLLDQFKRDWPRHYRSLLDANNSPAPMTLRVNRRQLPRDSYLKQLEEAGIAAHADALSPQGLHLMQPCDVLALPGFDAGWISVQDAASQLVAELLPLHDTARVLDACAAPGGKTCALLEAHPRLQLVALDADASRLTRVRENLARLQLNADVTEGDLTQAHPYAPASFDAILLDVPCSGTGVIRRHPDIKLLRTPEEVAALIRKQRALLDAAWPLLRSGAHLLYSTCSVLHAENAAQIAAFLTGHSDAHALPLTVPGAQLAPAEIGAQLLPASGGHDGFYYALLKKD